MREPGAFDCKVVSAGILLSNKVSSDSFALSSSDGMNGILGANNTVCGVLTSAVEPDFGLSHLCATSGILDAITTSPPLLALPKLSSLNFLLQLISLLMPPLGTTGTSFAPSALVELWSSPTPCLFSFLPAMSSRTPFTASPSST